MCYVLLCVLCEVPSVLLTLQGGQCALFVAALSGQADMLRMLLLELQMDPNSRDNVRVYYSEYFIPLCY